MSVLEFIKILFDKDTRDSIGKALEFFKNSPEWKKSLLTYDCSFSEKEQYDADAFIAFTLKLLKERNWAEQRIRDAEIVCNELKANHFTYGKQDGKKLKVDISIKITDDVFIISITDNGKGFLLQDKLQYPNNKLDYHGLDYVQLLANELSQENKNNLTSVIRKHPRPGMDIKKVNDIEIITLSGNMNHHEISEIRSELNVISQNNGFTSKVIVELSGVSYLDSSGAGLILVLYKMLHDAKTAFRFIWLNDSYVDHYFLVTAMDKIFVRAESLSDALKELSSPK
jgi:anti-anti-sigma factor